MREDRPDHERAHASGRRTAAVVLGLVGLLWLFQGIGVIGGSFMSSDPTWAVIGGGLVTVAFGLGWTTRRR